jgi:hypothetical protein
MTLDLVLGLVLKTFGLDLMTSVRCLGSIALDGISSFLFLGTVPSILRNPPSFLFRSLVPLPSIATMALFCAGKISRELRRFRNGVVTKELRYQNLGIPSGRALPAGSSTCRDGFICHVDIDTLCKHPRPSGTFPI